MLTNFYAIGFINDIVCAINAYYHLTHIQEFKNAIKTLSCAFGVVLKGDNQDLVPGKHTKPILDKHRIHPKS